MSFKYLNYKGFNKFNNPPGYNSNIKVPPYFAEVMTALTIIVIIGGFVGFCFLLSHTTEDDTALVKDDAYKEQDIEPDIEDCINILVGHDPLKLRITILGLGDSIFKAWGTENSRLNLPRLRARCEANKALSEEGPGL